MWQPALSEFKFELYFDCAANVIIPCINTQSENIQRCTHKINCRKNTPPRWGPRL